MDREKITGLIRSVADDGFLLEVVYNCLISFEEYHKAVYELETYKMVFNSDGQADREICERISEMDKTRTVCHNALIANVSRLNTLAKDSPVYEGVVSEERPYRREVANAVFAYMEAVINERA